MEKLDKETLRKAIFVLFGISVFLLGALLTLFIFVFLVPSSTQTEPDIIAPVTPITPVIVAEEQPIIQPMPDTQTAPPELIDELTSLQALVNELFAQEFSMDPQSLAQWAIGIALAHIGSGTVTDTFWVEESGEMALQVQIRSENIIHMVYVSATSGSVLRSESFLAE